MTQPPTGPGGQPPYPPPGGAGYGPGQPVPQQYGPTGQPNEPTRQFTPGQYGPPQPAEPTQQMPTQQMPQYPAPQPGQPAVPPPVPPAAPPVPPPAPAFGQQPPSAPPAPPFGQQPQSAPPFGQPVSTPPVSGPGYPQPMSVPPASGPGFGQPMSGPPGSAPPYGAPGTGGKGKRTALVLGLVAALLLVLGGVMTGLYVTKSSELNRTEQRLTAQVSERDGTIAANKTEIEKLKADLQSVRDKLSDTEQDLTGTRNDRDEQARQKKVIATCLDKLTSALAAAAANNKAAYDKATQGMNKICDEAENYL
ncbi:hypothetical protein ACFY2R_06400 [Micromonospora olivasterospora]|uniref:Uncharacterized protein n=1 Tax=Micromonospora olivasterospora TaxID=1880 RepID=A0A562IDJ6_MICOL|nr:hypothetical protein [Micromonospora olivasterospora]TWH69067.1 hypothetical protein JD77_04069 [Micromonospora olivasterospora]